MRLTIQTKLFISHFAAIILISGSVGTYFYRSASENLMGAQNDKTFMLRSITVLEHAARGR
jgi:hypothetical protein